MQKKSKYLLLFLLFYSFVSCTSETESGNKDNSQIFNLDNNWEYIVGDSPIDKKGNFIWLNDTTAWSYIGRLNNLPDSSLGNSIWLRTKLPSLQADNSSIYLDGVSQICQVFLDDKMIYQFGDFTSLETNHFKGWRRHLIELPNNFQGKNLTFRIWSNIDLIGIISTIKIGSTYSIIENIFINNIDEISFSIISLFLGITILTLFIFFQRDRLFLGMAIFKINIAVFTFSNCQLAQTLINAPYIFFLADIFSLCLAPIGGFIFMGAIIDKSYKNYLKLLIQLHSIHLIITAFLILSFNDQYLDFVLNTFMAIVVLDMLISFYFKSAFIYDNKKRRI